MFVPMIEFPFTLPCRSTHKEMGVELSRSPITKSYTVLVSKAWNDIATQLLYSAILPRGGRGVSVIWRTFRGSARVTRAFGLVITASGSTSREGTPELVACHLNSWPGGGKLQIYFGGFRTS